MSSTQTQKPVLEAPAVVVQPTVIHSQNVPTLPNLTTTSRDPEAQRNLGLITDFLNKGFGITKQFDGENPHRTVSSRNDRDFKVIENFDGNRKVTGYSVEGVVDGTGYFAEFSPTGDLRKGVVIDNGSPEQRDMKPEDLKKLMNAPQLRMPVSRR
jgi:hypothetical protein